MYMYILILLRANQMDTIAFHSSRQPFSRAGKRIMSQATLEAYVQGYVATGIIVMCE